MQLVLLGGNSKLNKEWIEEVENTLKDLFDSTHIHYYKHWEEDNGSIDMDYELGKLSEYLKDQKNYVIFAKSVGSILTVKGVHEKKLNPTSNILVGLAHSWAKSQNYEIDSWLKISTVPTLFIQKTGDPAIPFQELTELVGEEKMMNVTLQEMDGDDHHYANVGELKVYISRFLNISSPV